MPTSSTSSRAGSVSGRPPIRPAAPEIAAPLGRFLALSLRALLIVWRLTVSPLLGPACRFDPSCSRYADEALARFGLVRGSWLAARRVACCHPWNSGGHDPVPDAGGGPRRG